MHRGTVMFNGIGFNAHPETDVAFRKRIMYVAGDNDFNKRRIMVASDDKLDEIGEEYGLRRLMNPKEEWK